MVAGHRFYIIHYNIYKNKKRQPDWIAVSSVIPPGLEPGTPTLKVLCSTD